MARKPNYDFEKRQREKLKAEKAAERAKAKAAAKTAELGETADSGAPAPAIGAPAERD